MYNYISTILTYRTVNYKTEKTRNLKLVTQNLKNVELISALNLNTLAILKAQQILITTKAINDIKEKYCD